MRVCVRSLPEIARPASGAAGLRRQHIKLASGPLGNPGPRFIGAQVHRGDFHPVAARRGQNGEGQHGIEGERLKEAKRLAGWWLPRFEPCEQHHAPPFMACAVIEGLSGASVTPS